MTFSGLGFWDCEFAELKARGFGIWIGKQRKTRLPYVSLHSVCVSGSLCLCMHGMLTCMRLSSFVWFDYCYTGSVQNTNPRCTTIKTLQAQFLQTRIASYPKSDTLSQLESTRPNPGP